MVISTQLNPDSLKTDQQTLRSLAQRWMELAHLPVMADRQRAWTALKDLRAERPMVLFEVWTLEDYVAEAELACQDPFLRSVELEMRRAIRQVEEIGDDRVLEPLWRLGWVIHSSDYGVPIQAEHAQDERGGDVAYHYNHPIQSTADIERLLPRTYQVDRVESDRRLKLLQETFGDILPVTLHGVDSFLPGLTADLFRLLGNDRLLAWTYDEPDSLHTIMAYLRSDRLAYYTWLEREGLLGLNNTSQLVGSGSPGFTTALPAPGYAGQTRLFDEWIWMESQETTMISPRMFARLFLPYMAEISRLFGLVYYGCCEPVHDRWEPIIQAIPNIRAVSISPWCDQYQIAEKLGKAVVFSRKPRPWPVSGPNPDWQALEQDLDETVTAARDCNLEIIYRDVYRIEGDRMRLRRWVNLVRSRIGGE
jgi:hypothetical protein